MPLFSCLLLASALSPAPQMTAGPTAPAPPTTAPPAAAPIDTGPTRAGESLALSELFDMIRTRSPRFKAEQAQVDIARSRLRGATAFPNPMFNFQVLHLLSGYNQNGFGTFTAYLQQPLLIAGQRRQRKKAARVAIQAAESSVEEAFHELAAEGRHLFVALQARQAHERVLVGAIADLDRLRELVASRHASGAESRYDVARITLEVSKWRARISAARADVRDASGHIAVLVGRPKWRPRAEGELRSIALDVDADKLREDVARSHPAIKAARAHAKLADEDIKVARREAWPQPTLGFGMVGIDNFFSISALGGIVMPIPIFDWGQGPIARADAEARVAHLESEAVVAGVSAELDRAAAVVRERRGTLRQFETDVLSGTSELGRMAEDAYITGEASILELIDAVASRYELQVEQIGLLEALVHAEVDLLHVTGRVEEAFR